jgi:methyl-accepting chemotaxis protein
MTVGRKIVAGYALVLALLLVAVGAAFLAIRSLENTYTRFIEEDTQLILGATQLKLELRDQTAQFREILLYPQEESRLLDELRQSYRQFDAVIEQMRKLTRTDVGRGLVEQIAGLQIQHKAGEAKIIQMIQQRKRTEALDLNFKEVLPLTIELRKKCDRFIAQEQKILAEGRADLAATVKRASWAVMVASVVALLSGLAVAFLLTRMITGQLRDSVAQLSSSSAEILATTTQVASGAAETATAVNETTTTVEEVKQTAQVSAQKAKYVAESAQKTSQVSTRGKTAVGEAVEGMNRIREQMESVAESIVRLSEQNQAIGEIIATVNDLADQSNLLAVNAAIEAAKAGEHGKGFAVVAQEVKSLAEQSKQATAQVRGILGDVQKATTEAVMATEQGTKAVDRGVSVAAEAGDAIAKLAESIGESAQAATQIAASSQQQLVGMDQIATAMENIRQATTQNVAGTKQAEQAAQTLNALGGRLRSMIESRPV